MGAPKSRVVLGRFCSKFFLELFEVFFWAMASRGRPQSVQRGRGHSGVFRGREHVATDEVFEIGVGSQEFDEVEWEGLQRGRPAPRGEFELAGGRRFVAVRNRGGSVRQPSGSDREQAPAGAATPSPDSAGLEAQVSDHSHLGFNGVGRGTDNSSDFVRGRGRGRGVGPVRPAKGKNFVHEEERQLTRSVLVISQDPICGNQQKGNAYWERILLHYEQCRPGGHRGARSLESKWGTIKHDVGKFIGAYNQIKRLNKSGIKEADIIRMANDLYRTKTPKNTEFMFEHCWELVKDFPRWADGVSPSRQATPSRRLSGSSDHESQSVPKWTPKSL